MGCRVCRLAIGNAKASKLSIPQVGACASWISAEPCCMAFGIFIHRTDSVYDDVPSERYQFPKSYLSRAQQLEGDWIVYLEPTKVPYTKGYFAVSKVQEAVSDPRHDDRYLAVIEPCTYLDFGDPLPFRDAGEIVEQSPCSNVRIRPRRLRCPRCGRAGRVLWTDPLADGTPCMQANY